PASTSSRLRMISSMFSRLASISNTSSASSMIWMTNPAPLLAAANPAKVLFAGICTTHSNGSLRERRELRGFQLSPVKLSPKGGCAVSAELPTFSPAVRFPQQGPQAAGGDRGPRRPPQAGGAHSGRDASEEAVLL